MSNTNKLRTGAMLLAVMLMIGLAGCSASPQASVDPVGVDVTVATNPSPASINEEVKLTGQFAGIDLDKSATVSFEIRSGDQSEFVDAVYIGDNTFESPYTFTRSGINEVFVHLYSGDLHVTKKKPVEIQ